MKPLKSLTDHEFAEVVRQAAELRDAPAALLKSAIALWPAARTAPQETVVQGIVRRVVAALSFDSWAAAPLAMGMRSVPSATRHLLFSAMGRDIDLRITPGAGHFALTGQVLGPDDAGVVELVAKAGDNILTHDTRMAPLDALGEFRIGGVERGTYLLTLRLGADEIVLPPISVGERES